MQREVRRTNVEVGVSLRREDVQSSRVKNVTVGALKDLMELADLLSVVTRGRGSQLS